MQVKLDEAVEEKRKAKADLDALKSQSKVRTHALLDASLNIVHTVPCCWQTVLHQPS